MIELAPEIFQQFTNDRSLFCAATLSHSFFFYALLTLPLAYYSRTSDVALSPRNDPSHDLVSSRKSI